MTPDRSRSRSGRRPALRTWLALALGVATGAALAPVSPAFAEAAPAFVNPGFEAPQLGSYSYNPAGSGWTFTGNAGIQRNGSAYSGSHLAPEGTQTAFVQGLRNGTVGTMSQTVGLPAGSYTIGFLAARRGGTVQPVRVSVDGTVIGVYTPAGGTFTQITTAAFAVAAGPHAVTFAATDGTADRTTFLDSVIISIAGAPTAPPPTVPAPAAPLSPAAVAGNAQVTVSWAASAGASGYRVYRGTTAGGQSATPLATGLATTGYVDSAVTNGTAYYYTVRAVNATGSSPDSAEVVATPVAPTPPPVPTTPTAVAGFLNASFETPQLGGYSYSPVGSSWTFTGNAGIQRNGSAYSGSTQAPHGTQTAFLQGLRGTVGTMSQNVTTSAGTFAIAFQAARRYGTVQPIRVSVDGVAVGTYTPAGAGFATLTSSTFALTAGSHAVTLSATDGTADRSAFVDQISLIRMGAGGPAPTGDIDLTGYSLTFRDEFDSLSVASRTPKGSSTWYAFPPYGPAGNYSVSTWTASALSANNGILSNKAYRGTAPGTTGTWYSGNISSVDTTGAGFAQQYGYFEARIKMPDSGTGAWSAFWLNGVSSIDAPNGINEEVDVVEWYGTTNMPNTQQALVQQASHNYLDGREDKTAPYLYSPQTPIPDGTLPWQGFHTYGVQIDPVHITWFIDGVQTNQIATPTRYVTSRFYLMLDYALGGGWPITGMVDGSTMQVDWVRVYALPT